MNDDYHSDCYCTECEKVRSLDFIGEQLEQLNDLLKKIVIRQKL